MNFSKSKNNIPEIPQNSLIVSCQAEGNDPFNSPYGVSLFARAAEMGGAGAIRSEGIAKTGMILKKVNIPVIGLVKGKYPDNSVCITRNISNIESLIKIGCRLIAIDGTFRIKNNLSGPEFIQFIKQRFDCNIVADISTEQEAIECHSAGADYIATTLSGYTPETFKKGIHNPDFELVSSLAKNRIPKIIAEGRVQNFTHAKRMIQAGAWAVVIGTSITRPRIVIQRIVQQLILIK
jgi:N-acylglucosamine-6-phosphate 2-epimerase